MQTKPKYEVFIAGEWCSAKITAIHPSGWADYKIRDGTTGLVPPAKFREVDKNRPLRTWQQCDEENRKPLH